MDYIVVLASIAGGLCNYNTKKVKGKRPKGGHINWLVERKRHRQELPMNKILDDVAASRARAH